MEIQEKPKRENREMRWRIGKIILRRESEKKRAETRQQNDKYGDFRARAVFGSEKADRHVGK